MEQIDFVIPWVDGADPAWQAELRRFRPDFNAEGSARYRDWGLLRYWFRGVETYAPWVHKIYFITWGHLPEWLDTTNEKLVIVNHRDYIPAEYLPTFNSNAIELNIHRIPGLGEQFVLFNDDMFLGRPVEPEDFFQGGKPRDAFILDAVYFAPTSVGGIIGSDLEIINKYFTPREQLRKLHLSQYLYPGYGLRNLYRNIVLRVWPWFPGIYCEHITSSLLKSTLEEVWSREPEALDDACRHRFRTKAEVNQWLFKFWQLVQGNFVPRSTSFGRAFHLEGQINQELLAAIAGQKYGILCINDSERTENVEAQAEAIRRAFQQALPTPCSFERAVQCRGEFSPEGQSATL